jgi:hypothetical protein
MSCRFQGQILPNLRTSGTVRSFFSGMNNGWPWENHSPLTQVSKAAALFERAARLAATWRPGALALPFRNILLLIDGLEEIQNFGSFYSDFVAVDQRIDEFKSQLTPLDRVSGHGVPLVHLAYCLSNGATIQLHAPFSSQNTGSRAKCLSAALAIVGANQGAQAREYAYTSPILGVSFWLCVSLLSWVMSDVLPLGSRFGPPVGASSSTKLSRGDACMLNRPCRLDSAIPNFVMHWNKFSP